MALRSNPNKETFFKVKNSNIEGSPATPCHKIGAECLRNKQTGLQVRFQTIIPHLTCLRQLKPTARPAAMFLIVSKSKVSL